MLLLDLTLTLLVRKSWVWFEDLISKASHDDYVFLIYSMKMSEYGFFDLSNQLISKENTSPIVINCEYIASIW